MRPRSQMKVSHAIRQKLLCNSIAKKTRAFASHRVCAVRRFSHITKQDLPVIDVQHLLAGAEEGEQLHADSSLMSACKGPNKLGFFYVTQTPRAKELLLQLRAQAVEFFGLDMAAKLQLVSKTGGFGGYCPIGGELSTQDGQYTSNNCEALDIVLRGQVGAAQWHLLSSVDWKLCAVTRALRENIKLYWIECVKVGRALVRSVARGLGIRPSERDLLERAFAEPDCGMRLLKYPCTPAPSDNAAAALDRHGLLAPLGIGTGAHTDFECFTLLDATGEGLQVLTPDISRGGDLEAGAWRSVPHVNGAWVVNVGDAMAFWTEGGLQSTRHRVAVDPHSEAPRFSVPFFFGPARHAPLRPLLPPLLPPRDTTASPAPHNCSRGGGLSPSAGQVQSLTYGEYLDGKIALAFPPLTESILTRENEKQPVV